LVLCVGCNNNDLSALLFHYSSECDPAVLLIIDAYVGSPPILREFSNIKSIGNFIMSVNIKQKQTVRAVSDHSSEKDWSIIGPGIHVKALAIDETRHTIEYLLKEDANWKPGLHRHLCETSLLVLEGSIINRGTGHEYLPGDFFYQEKGHTHDEEMGKDGIVAYVSMRGTSDTLVEFLDEAGEVYGSVKISDFAHLLPA